MKKQESVREKIRQSLRLGRATGLVWKAAPGWTLASIILIVIQGVMPLVTLYLIKLVVDAVVEGMGSADRTAAFGHVALLIGITGAAALVTAMSRSVAGLVNEAQSVVVTDYMHRIIHSKSIEVDLGYYENPQYYDTLHRAQMEAPYRPTQIVGGLAQLGQSSLSLVAIAGLLFTFHWAVALILFAAVLPGVIVRLRYAGHLYRWQRKRTPAEREADYVHWMLTGDVHAKEIRLFNLGPMLIKRYSGLRKLLRTERIDISMKKALAELITHSGAVIAIFASLAFIAYRAVQGSISIGEMVMYYQAFQRGQAFLQEVLRSLAQLYEDNLFLSYLYEFLDLKPSVVEPSSPKPVPGNIRKNISFEKLSFRYPSADRDALTDINLEISPGEVIALVGKNGSGKTTLIKLLCRLYDPTSGSISIDGSDLREFRTDELRRIFSVIFQDFAKYHLTAGENIRFGDIDLPEDSEKIIEASRKSGAHEVISSLPTGYDTVLGRWFDEGKELSIGEWQKVALARAFLRDSRIMVLDEPTSSMDASSEFEVFSRFSQLAEGRTAIIISHRFSTVRMADRIIVLDQGKILENGTHEELMSIGGIYAHLFETQAKSYRLKSD